MNATAEISTGAIEVFAAGLDHPEGLAFDRQGELWCGSESGIVYRISPQRKISQAANLESYCAGLAFSPLDQSLFVCQPARGITRIEPNGDTSFFAVKAGDHKIVCAKHGVFDAKGNYYVTDAGLWNKTNGFLLKFTPDGRGEILAGPFALANGLALSADEKFLYMVESQTERILRFDLTTSGKEIYAENCGRFPHGLTLDAEGNLYVCCYASDEIWRIDPERKKTLFAQDRWGLQLGSPTALVFGGPETNELFVANLSRWHISRIKTSHVGLPPSHLKVKTRFRPRPAAL